MKWKMSAKCNFSKDCNNKVIISLPFLKLSLCKEHYLKNIEERTKETIINNNLIDYSDPNEKVLIALSGGKDSQVLFNILAKKISKPER